MKILRVNGSNKDFVYLCEELENFQFNLMPVLREKGYCLTDDLHEIEGFILYDNEKPIGSIGLKRINEDTCEIVRVFISDNYRGNGYAGLLFEKIEDLAKNMGFIKAEMVAWSLSVSALALYKKLGYKFSEEKKSEWFEGFYYIELTKDL